MKEKRYNVISWEMLATTVSGPVAEEKKAELVEPAKLEVVVDKKPEAPVEPAKLEVVVDKKPEAPVEPAKLEVVVDKKPEAPVEPAKLEVVVDKKPEAPVEPAKLEVVVDKKPEAPLSPEKVEGVPEKVEKPEKHAVAVEEKPANSERVPEATALKEEGLEGLGCSSQKNKSQETDEPIKLVPTKAEKSKKAIASAKAKKKQPMKPSKASISKKSVASKVEKSPSAKEKTAKKLVSGKPKNAVPAKKSTPVLGKKGGASRGAVHSRDGKNKVLLNNIVLVSNSNEVETDISAEGVHLKSIDVPGNPAQLVRTLKKNLGSLLNSELIHTLREQIRAYYQSQGDSQVDIEIPAQDFTRGRLQFVIKPKKK